jgi:hypothetical protein
MVFATFNDLEIRYYAHLFNFHTYKRGALHIKCTPTIDIEPNKKRHGNTMTLQDDPYGIRTRVTAVKGRCLNHLTNGPYIYFLTHWRRRRDLNPRAAKTRPNGLANRPLQPLGYFSKMAPQVGFEPTTYRLTAGCSTAELLRNDNKKFVF